MDLLLIIIVIIIIWILIQYIKPEGIRNPCTEKKIQERTTKGECSREDETEEEFTTTVDNVVEEENSEGNLKVLRSESEEDDDVVSDVMEEDMLSYDDVAEEKYTVLHAVMMLKGELKAEEGDVRIHAILDASDSTVEEIDVERKKRTSGMEKDIANSEGVKENKAFVPHTTEDKTETILNSNSGTNLDLHINTVDNDAVDQDLSENKTTSICRNENSAEDSGKAHETSLKLAESSEELDETLTINLSVEPIVDSVTSTIILSSNSSAETAEDSVEFSEIPSSNLGSESPKDSVELKETLPLNLCVEPTESSVKLIKQKVDANVANNEIEIYDSKATEIVSSDDVVVTKGSSNINNEVDKSAEEENLIASQILEYVNDKHNLDTEFRILEMQQEQHQKKLEFTEISEEEKTEYRHVVKRGEDYTEEIQSTSELSNENYFTSSAVTTQSDNISSEHHTSSSSSTTITKIVNMSYTEESTESVEINSEVPTSMEEIFFQKLQHQKNSITDGGINILGESTTQTRSLSLKEEISSGSLLGNNAESDAVLSDLELGESCPVKKKPACGVYLFGGDELLSKIKSRRIIIDKHESEKKQKPETENNWRLSTINKAKEPRSHTQTEVKTQTIYFKENTNKQTLSVNTYQQTPTDMGLSEAINLNSRTADAQWSSRANLSPKSGEINLQNMATPSDEMELMSIHLPALEGEMLMHLNKDRPKGPLRRRRPPLSAVRTE